MTTLPRNCEEMRTTVKVMFAHGVNTIDDIVWMDAGLVRVRVANLADRAAATTAARELKAAHGITVDLE